MNTHDIGDVVKVTATFTTDGVPTDPTTVSLKVKKPGSDLVTYVYGEGVIVRDSAGVYHAEISPSKAGFHYYRWLSSGIAAAAEEGIFYVRHANVH